jgi:hypothetical protein
VGTPLGYAPNGSPYNQLINGHQYLLETMWSNADSGCKQSGTSTASALPLPSVNLKQYSATVTGSSGAAKAGVSVTVILARTGEVVAGAGTRTAGNGSWRVTLRSVTDGAPVGVGDDREELLVRYGSGGPQPELIQTGNGGNPFAQSGWTGWFALDHGFAVHTNSVVIGPCSQTGVLSLTIDHVAQPDPLDVCGSETDASVVQTHPLGPGSVLSLSSEDNRAPTEVAPNGALVTLTVTPGEPGAVDPLGNNQVLFNTTGMAACTADLRAQRVTCDGLVTGARYTLVRSRRGATIRALARRGGVIEFPRFHQGGITGGDALTLRNRSGRALSTLHVAHLRVNLTGNATVITSGTCEPGDYYGSELTTPPLGPGIGAPGVAGDGTICPLSGGARRLSTTHILQLDDRSAGATRTEVPTIEGTAPVQNATLYGPFVALAEAGLPGPHNTVIPTRARIAVTITQAGSHHAAFHAANVDTAGGARVSGLAPGSYGAEWVLTDANGDTRTVHTKFVEAG